MMNQDQITRPQADALAALIHQLREEWGVPGIITALYDARERGTAYELAHAALYAAADLKHRTPAIIALAGPHWQRGRVDDTGPGWKAPRCPIEGHSSYPAHNCGACRSELVAADTDQARALASQGLSRERIQQILASTPTDDAKTRASGDDR